MPEEDRTIVDPVLGPVRLSGVVPAGPMRVPRQNVRIGRAGYVGKVEEYDPKYPNVKLVQEEDEPEAVVSEPKPRRKRRKAKTEDKAR